MQGKTHAAVGVATYVFLCSKLPGKFSTIGMIVTVVSSIIPDIDHPKSIINKYLLPKKSEKTKRVFYAALGIIILCFDKIYTRDIGVKAVGIAFICISLNSHRNGFSHSFLGFVLASIIGSIVEVRINTPYLTLYIVAGYMSHLIGDMFTKHGIPLFYPFNIIKVKFPINYSVGSKKGRFIEGIIRILVMIYIVYSFMPWQILRIYN